MLTLEVVIFLMGGVGSIMLNSEKKGTSSQKKNSEDLDASELKYPENEEGE